MAAKRGSGLEPVGGEALEAFRAARADMMRGVVARSMERTDEVAHHGPRAELVLTGGLEYTFKMLEAAMAVGEVGILEDQLQWAAVRLPHDGVQPGHILSRFRILRDVVEATLPPDHAREIVPYLKWLIDRQRSLMGD